MKTFVRFIAIILKHSELLKESENIVFVNGKNEVQQVASDIFKSVKIYCTPKKKILFFSLVFIIAEILNRFKMNKKHPKALPYLFLSEMWERVRFLSHAWYFFPLHDRHTTWWYGKWTEKKLQIFSEHSLHYLPYSVCWWINC